MIRILEEIIRDPGHERDRPLYGDPHPEGVSGADGGR
jgi:hypothetical protein